MTRSIQHPWLNRFAALTAFATFLLLGIGGLVTSKGAGMAVPDWPTTYGYNMFLFPIHLWTGGIFYEHTHRLFASGVGLLTLILAVWLWVGESRRWLRWLGVGALLAVIVQGVLGGLRVTLYKDEIGIVHAILAQGFFLTLSFIALALSPRGRDLLQALRDRRCSAGLQWLTVVATFLIFVQLILGASMRHQHAGLAVPDFPLAYGRIWPRLDPAFLEKVNQTRLQVQDYKPITAMHIALHMAHRISALLILGAVLGAATLARRELGKSASVSKATLIWAGVIGTQVLLGAATVWSGKAADMATAHVLVGALSLLSGAVLSVGLIRARQATRWCVPRELLQSPALSSVALRQPKPSAP